MILSDTITPSRLHAASLRGTLRARSRLSRLVHTLWRRALLRGRDRPVTHVFEGVPITLPFSHALPIYFEEHPHYDRALPRLARCVQGGSGGQGAEFVIVDIGANVGDSAAMLLRVPDVFVIAVEGNPAYIPYLHANLKGLEARSHVAERYVGPEAMPGFTIETASGSAKLVGGGGTGGVALVSLQSILDEAGKRRVDFIKIDTDGFDIAIIRDTLGLLARGGATLFFEFDPALFENVSADGWAVFGELAQAGYVAGIAYLNTGQFVRSFSLGDVRAIAELRAYLAAAPRASYLDFAMFKRADLFERCLASEIAHFAGG